METLTKNIYEIVTAEASTISEKIKGLNYLEILKNNLIDKVLPLIISQKFPNDQIINFEKIIEENTRNINVSINYYDKSISISKKTIENDSLFITFNEISSLDIYKDQRNFYSLLLYKNTGITLPKDTIINLKINKNVLMLEIKNNLIEEILTK